MVSSLKDSAEEYTNDWLREVVSYDENGDPVTNVDKIYSRRLIEELIAYNRKGNFDAVSALFMLMFSVKENIFEREFSTENPETTWSRFDDFHQKRYQQRIMKNRFNYIS